MNITLPKQAFRTWARAMTLAYATSVQSFGRKIVCAYEMNAYNKRVKLRLQGQLGTAQLFSTQN